MTLKARNTQKAVELFRVAHARGPDWQAAAGACAERLGRPPASGTLGFLYVTDALAQDMGHIHEYLRVRTGVTHWVGTVGMGIWGNGTEYYDEAAVAVMVLDLPEAAFCVLPTISHATADVPAAERTWIDRENPLFGVVHGDPMNPRTPALLDQLSRETSGFLVGGLSSSRGPNHHIAERLTGGGLSGVLFAPTVGVQTGLSQGCQPIGPTHVVSECEDNIIMALDDRPALDVFKQDIGEILAHDLRRVGGYIHAALPLRGSDTGDYMVRNLVGIDPSRGWLAIGEVVATGDAILFVRRDADSACEDLKSMLTRLRGRLEGVPRGGLYFSCVARGPNMFGAAGAETGIIHDALGDVPLVGFACGGEISNGRLYGYTGVLALFT